MANLGFLSILILQLALATLLLSLHSWTGVGLVLCGSLYLTFIAGFFFAAKSVVLSSWLALSAVNMVIQYRDMRRKRITRGMLGVLRASIWLWPIQFAGLLVGEGQRKVIENSKSLQRERLGELPATISGTVSVTHHIGTDDGEEMVWLEEYGDLEFFVTSAKYDEIGIQEGSTVSLSVEERESADTGEAKRTMWIVDGIKLDG